ncbi:dual specificity phosphatase catalytic domain protein [Penicillium macrosclerotiorum]|uniref:dual specificity phosphatase catalytic domain protein n=1 Tax=Penicillium macrosclerotiorum TaxID=303699 RepID=UPI0025490C72|nr:dual specificity phosphatase catalytic domain protein [Penicillium macrosclerotiorum]KAJ5693078.1 dual specificity phosphatase catalytic domain protein [Penicillium macrosclerotiorum]
MASKPRMRQIVPDLILGNVRSYHNRELIEENHINAVVSLTHAPWVWWNTITREAGVPKDCHKFVQCADSSKQGVLVYLGNICDFMDQVASPALCATGSLPTECNAEDARRDGPGASKAVLIHCDLGISRPPSPIIVYLMRNLRMPRAEVFGFVRSKQKIKRKPHSPARGLGEG